MAVDVFVGSLVFTRGLCRVHTTRATSHRREFYVRFVATSAFRIETARVQWFKCETVAKSSCIFRNSCP